MPVRTDNRVEEMASAAGGAIHLLRGGAGAPVLVLHHDAGNPGWAPFYDALAGQFTVYLPSHPGYGRSTVPEWARDVRDLALIYHWLLRDLDLSGLPVVGFGLGAWIVAEMATMCPNHFSRLVLVGAAGLKPDEGEIADQFMMSSIEFMRAGFHDQAKFDALFGSEPGLDQLEAWEISREMTTRIAWAPYMFSQSLPHLLGGVRLPTLLVWGREDRIVPLNCGERYASLLPNARLTVVDDCGHFVDFEQPERLGELVRAFLAE